MPCEACEKAAGCEDMKITNRNNEQVTIRFEDQDAMPVGMSMEEFLVMSDCFKASIGPVAKKLVTGLDAPGTLALGKAVLKSMLRQSNNDEKEFIRRRIMEQGNAKERIGRMRVAVIGYRGQTSRIRFSPRLFSLLTQVFVRNQYDINEANVRGKTIVDVGANIGDFSLMCACLGAGRVYAFEPVEKNYRELVDNIAENGWKNVIIPVNAGLGDKKERIRVEEETLMGTASPDAPLVEVVRLDDYLQENGIGRIDFLKMDVEGYEENVLLGARGAIARDKPVLSFSAYHKPTDMKRLPQVVREIRADYRIRLNRYAELDFYCD